MGFAFVAESRRMVFLPSPAFWHLRWVTAPVAPLPVPSTVCPAGIPTAFKGHCGAETFISWVVAEAGRVHGHSHLPDPAL